MRYGWVVRCGNLYLTNNGWLDLKKYAAIEFSFLGGVWSLLKTIRLFPRLERIELPESPAGEKWDPK